MIGLKIEVDRKAVGRKVIKRVIDLTVGRIWISLMSLGINAILPTQENE